MKLNLVIFILSTAAILLAMLLGIYLAHLNTKDLPQYKHELKHPDLINNIQFNHDEMKLENKKINSISYPAWAQAMIEIENNPFYNREKKIEKLIILLKQNQDNQQALHNVLIALTAYHPLEAMDDLMPYLDSDDPNVQILTLGALANASLLTEKEHQLKRALPENVLKRRKINEAIKKVQNNPQTSAVVKQALSSMQF